MNKSIQKGIIVLLLALLVISIGGVVYPFATANYRYTKAVIKIGEEYETVGIKEWEELEDGWMKIFTSTGKIYSTQKMNVVMIGE